MREVKQRLRPLVVSGAERAASVARRHNWLADSAPTNATAPDVSVAPEGGEPPAEAAPEVDRFGLVGVGSMLHVLRGAALSTMPKIDGTMLSAGCADASYFNWIAETYGPVKRHIGLELYVPQPPELPSWVDWIASSVSHMEGVADASIGLVFSGQNFEHLFGNDAVDFLLESRRVLEPGGWLVMDSPERAITAALNWFQQEHTVEFTAAEAAELVTLAGFDVTRLRGLWLCREPATGELYPLWPDTGAPSANEVAHRIAYGDANPELSFIWWLEARKADREPQREQLRARHAEIFAHAWPERLARLHVGVGERRELDGRDVVSVARGSAGHAIYGPYAPLTPGHYAVTFALRRSGPVDDDAHVATVEMADGAGTVLREQAVTAAELPAGQWQPFRLELDNPELVWGAQFRVWSTGAAELDVEFAVPFEESGTSVAPTP